VPPALVELMRLYAKAAVFGVFATVGAAQNGRPHLTLEQQLHGPYGIRIQILKRMLLSDDLLAEPRLGEQSFGF
jgi:hypothetical protein